MTDQPIRLALPSKGHLYEGTIELLRAAGFKIRRASDRQYEATISGHPRFHVVFMRPADIVAQVEEGRCTLGVTGMDVYAEHADQDGASLVVEADLGYGGCRLVVAVPESWVDVDHILDLADLTSEFQSSGRTFRVSTKYPNVVRSHFRKWGIYHYQLVASDGALELHPTLGIADIIVDLTSSGSTLKDNRLREIACGTVLESAAALIGHAPALAALAGEGDGSPVVELLDALDGVRASESLRHVEVVGAAGSAAEVAERLRRLGGQHVCHGKVWGEREQPGWRVTALVPARAVPGLRRPLLALGAGRIVALAPGSVFDSLSFSIYDRLCIELTKRGERASAKPAQVEGPAGPGG
jgi:ATP phosphoribosyltransferase